MPVIIIDISCAKCGKDLDTSITGTDIEVEPCPDCLEESYNDGYDQAQKDIVLED